MYRIILFDIPIAISKNEHMVAQSWLPWDKGRDSIVQQASAFARHQKKMR